MIFLVGFEITSVASLDINGDGNTEVFVGTDKGLIILPDISSGEYKETGIKSPVKHISYDPENLRLILTLDDPSSPISFLKITTLEDSSLPITGTYKKAFYLNGKIYLLSDIGLFEYYNDSMYLVKEGIKDITICGVGGKKNLFAVSENKTYIFGNGNLWIKGGGSTVVCGDSAVYTSDGYIRYSQNGFVFETNLEPIKVYNITVNSYNFVSIASYMNRVYVIYGKNNINRHPISKPFISYDRPFVIKNDSTSIFVADMNLYYGISYGIYPVSIGRYTLVSGNREVEISINDYGSYNLRNIFAGDDILRVSYGRGNVEMYINITEPSRVEIYITSITGNVVKTLIRDFKSSSFKVSWNGYGDNGTEVRRGVYFVKAVINDRVYVKRVVWLK